MAWVPDQNSPWELFPVLLVRAVSSQLLACIQIHFYEQFYHSMERHKAILRAHRADAATCMDVLSVESVRGRSVKEHSSVTVWGKEAEGGK